MPNIVNGLGQVKVGVRIASGGGGGIDTDAQAFITAANITDSTQQSAINTLVTQLKTYGIWTKLKAVYPFVGGTASSHKFNLKDPRDLDAAFRLVFNGGGTHSATGYQPNGTTAYANTYLSPSSTLSSPNSTHISYYSRTNNAVESVDFGTQSVGGVNMLNAGIRQGNSYTYFRINRTYTTAESFTLIPDSRLFYMINRTSSTQEILFTNTTKYTFSKNSTGLPNLPIYIGAYNASGPAGYPGSKECAFFTVGDGLTDTEATNLYTAVQTFQTTLGRQVGVPIVADTDAQAFLNAAVITDQTQANAINTLVTDLKSANIWTKMKALYPFVGGTATTHKFNLKDPRDLDAAYRLVFNGGWTHSSTGALPNGSNAFADTKLIPSLNLILNSTHISVYSRTNVNGDYVDIGVVDAAATTVLQLIPKHNNNIFYGQINDVNFSENITVTDSLGLFIGNRQSSTSVKLIKNNTLITNKISNSSSLVPAPLYLSARNNASINVSFYSPRQQAFASIGDGLTDAEATAFYNAVQAYQTTLGRQV